MHCGDINSCEFILNVTSRCIHFHENCALVTKSGGFVSLFQCKYLRFFSQIIKVHFEQTNFLSIKRHLDYKSTYGRDTCCTFCTFFVMHYRYYFT